jgi:hypothetical protein
MQDLADHQARQLVDALKALGLDGVAVRGRAYLPASGRVDRNTPWGRRWRITLNVRQDSQEVAVEHLDDAPFRAGVTARTVGRILGGAYADERYRCDRLGALGEGPQRYSAIVSYFVGRTATNGTRSSFVERLAAAANEDGLMHLQSR